MALVMVRILFTRVFGEQCILANEQSVGFLHTIVFFISDSVVVIYYAFDPINADFPFQIYLSGIKGTECGLGNAVNIFIDFN